VELRNGVGGTLRDDEEEGRCGVGGAASSGMGDSGWSEAGNMVSVVGPARRLASVWMTSWDDAPCLRHDVLPLPSLDSRVSLVYSHA
jgi:hypothetical protein